MSKHCILPPLFLLVAVTTTSAQVAIDTSIVEKSHHLSVGGYIDAYYGYNFNQPEGGNNPYFVSMNRDNEATINLAYITLRYQSDRVRARLVPGFGTYMNANYALEDGLMKNFVEASIGYQLSPKKDIWIDYGVLGSPYTNESAISRDHLMYSRSFAPEYVPYYLSGAKISLPVSKKINAYFYLLNGWQQIKDQNRQKSIGTQLEYKPNNRHLFNWNTYIGDERSVLAPTSRMRYFTDIYWIYNPDGQFSITSCAYIGMQALIGSTNEMLHRTWWQVNLASRIKIDEKISISGRLEYFSDPHSIQITPITRPSGFDSYSSSMCMNIRLNENALFRTEIRHFQSGDAVFLSSKNHPTNQSFWGLSSLTVWF